MQRARTEEAKDQRRRALVQAALEEFFERGFKAARMEDIARRAGLTKGTLYLYFNSKETLFRHLIETVALPNVKRLEVLVNASGSVREAIPALMKMMAHIIQETSLPKIIKILIADAGVFPEVMVFYREKVINRGISAIGRLLQKGQETGEIKVENPRLTARLVIAPVILSAIWRVVFEAADSERVDLEALFSLHASMLLGALSIDEEAS